MKPVLQSLFIGGLLAAASIPAAARPVVTEPARRAGGDSSGGGSTLEGTLLDTYVRKSAVRFYEDAELSRELDLITNMLRDAFPDVSLNFWAFYEGDKAKRVIPVATLPKFEAGDVKHEAADGLIAIQRGPHIWVLKSFWQAANGEQKADFLVHEYLVGQKLLAGSLSARDRDEVVHVTARFAELAQQHARKISPVTGKEIQKLLEENHFRSPLRREETDQISNLGSKMLSAIQRGCRFKKPDPKALKELKSYFEYVKRQSEDEENSLAYRAELKDQAATYEKALRENRGDVCEYMRKFYRDLKLSIEISGDKSVTIDQKFLEEILGPIEK